MAGIRRMHLILAVALPLFSVVVLFLAFYCYLRRRYNRRRKMESLEAGGYGEPEPESEELVRFAGGESLTAHDILDAPGEVVGKSGYSTLYRATLQRSGAAVLLRFVRPACAAPSKEILPAVRAMGAVRHRNLVSLRALYVGPRGEKLFVHPFYPAVILSHFLHEGNAQAHRWEVIYKISLDIANGLDHLHTRFPKPIIHGNLKSNNILLDADFHSRISDFGLHLILNPTAGQEMLEAAAAQGYKAPELIKMKEATQESDIYSLGVIFLEMLTRKEPVNNSFLHSKDMHLPTSLRNLVLEHKISDIFNSKLLSQSTNQNSANEECLLRYFQVAMACCSPSPVLRPDIKQVIRKLEEIGRY